MEKPPATPVCAPESIWEGVRELTPAPAAGVHPRVFFGPEELPDIRARLQETLVGREVITQVRLFTLVMREGRSAYDQLPQEQRCFQHGKKRIANVGIYDNKVVYNRLCEGDAGAMADLPTPQNLGSLAGGMALEAFECLVDAEEAEASAEARLSRLATALDAWARWSLEQEEELSYVMHFALAYDMAHGGMSEEQRSTVRQALTKVLTSPYYWKHDNGYYGSTTEPEATTSNWATLDTFKAIVACSVEGETEEHGLTSSSLEAWFRGAMRSQEAFFTHGLHSSGATYEGQGKNYIFATHQIAFARRGFNFFGHPHVRAYGSQWLPALVQPFGYSFLAYDLLGGTGPDPVLGKYVFHLQDFIGLKFMYPDDPGIDYAYRNALYEPVQDGEDVIWLDNERFGHRQFQQNNLLCAAIFPCDPTCDCSAGSREHALKGSLDFLDQCGATLVANSSFDHDACTLQMHVRQDTGGHTFADKGAFTLAALGRLFFVFSGAKGGVESRFHGETLVDGLASKPTRHEGFKSMVPAKLAAWSLSGQAAFATCDATYSYSTDWNYKPYPADGDMQLFDERTAEMVSHNTFRRSNNKLQQSHGDVPFCRFPRCIQPGHLNGMQKKPHNPMRQVLRTVGLIRGARPYVLMMEDIQKDDEPHDYIWHIPIAKDLQLVCDGAELPDGADSSTDVVLREPEGAGDRCLLVRILSAKGDRPASEEAGGLAPAHRDVIVDEDGVNYPRLVITRFAVVAPEYLVLFFPFRWGEDLLRTELSDDTLEAVVGEQHDTFKICRREAAAELREFVLERDGEALVDYRELIEPVELPPDAGDA